MLKADLVEEHELAQLAQVLRQLPADAAAVVVQPEVEDQQVSGQAPPQLRAEQRRQSANDLSPVVDADLRCTGPML